MASIEQRVAWEVFAILCDWNMGDYLRFALEVKEGDELKPWISRLRNNARIDLALGQLPEERVGRIAQTVAQMCMMIKAAQTPPQAPQSDMMPTHAFARPTEPPQTNPVHEVGVSANYVKALRQCITTGTAYIQRITQKMPNTLPEWYGWKEAAAPYLELAEMLLAVELDAPDEPVPPEQPAFVLLRKLAEREEDNARRRGLTTEEGTGWALAWQEVLKILTGEDDEPPPDDAAEHWESFPPTHRP